AQALAEAAKKGEQERAAAEARLAKEKADRDKADAERKKKEDAYAAHMKAAGEALAARKYDDAVNHYKEAAGLFRTDAALSGLKGATELRDRDKAAREAEAKRKAEEEQKAALVKKSLDDARAATQAGKFDDAVKALDAAARLAPDSVEVKAERARVEAARNDFLQKNRARVEEERRQAEAYRLMEKGRLDFEAKRYDSAIAALSEAAKLDPKNPIASSLLREAQRRRDALPA